MSRAVIVALACVACLLTASLIAQEPATPAFVELDVVVLDHDRRPVRDLRPRDFLVEEDGRTAAVASVKEVAVAGIGGREDARSVVLLLDNTDLRWPVAARRIAAAARAA